MRPRKLVPGGIGGKGLAGDPLRIYAGKDLPPRAIRWDAEDAAGRKLPAGFYAFRLEAGDMAGNAAATSRHLIRLDDAETIGTVSKP